MPVTGTSDLMRTAISNSRPSRPKSERRTVAPDRCRRLASTTPAMGWSIPQNACIGADVSPDLVAHGVAMLAAEQRYVFLLDIVGVRDRGGRPQWTERREPQVGLVLGKQRFGCAPGRDILHGPSPFFANPSGPGAAVKQAGGPWRSTPAVRAAYP